MLEDHGKRHGTLADSCHLHHIEDLVGRVRPELLVPDCGEVLRCVHSPEQHGSVLAGETLSQTLEAHHQVLQQTLGELESLDCTQGEHALDREGDEDH